MGQLCAKRQRQAREHKLISYGKQWSTNLLMAGLLYHKKPISRIPDHVIVFEGGQACLPEQCPDQAYDWLVFYDQQASH